MHAQKPLKPDLAQLYFVGHTGSLKRLVNQKGKLSFVPDSNLVLNLLQKSNEYKSLPLEYQEFLRVTRAQMRARQAAPVNPVLAILELSKQDEVPDFQAYFQKFSEFFETVYPGTSFAPQWVLDVYVAAQRVVMGQLPTFTSLVQKTLELMPAGDTATDKQVISAVDSLFEWLFENRESCAVIGGMPLYVSIWGLAGSPEARRILKVSSARKGDTPSVAKNVGWDYMYWMFKEMEYQTHRHDNTIFCTGDKALALLLGSKIDQGPRIPLAISGAFGAIPAYGNFTPFKFKKLEGTSLSEKLEEKLGSFLRGVADHADDSMLVGFNNITGA